MLVAPEALAAVCREIVAEEGPGLAFAAVAGPALAATSPTVVTTFVTAVLVLRLVVATDPACDATTGESEADWPVAAVRRTIVGEAVGCVAAEAIWAGAGSPVALAVCGLSVACRRVARLVGETSAEAVGAETVPAAA